VTDETLDAVEYETLKLWISPDLLEEWAPVFRPPRRVDSGDATPAHETSH
jgi:hypothetical protein